ncbi:MAG: VacB/RNase II family 3'-5' exoribonuclease [Desulfovibrio sp.]|nr:VacB/RNase II family 3'-5' exoribonuclease [Desulfovibrio sp.]
MAKHQEAQLAPATEESVTMALRRYRKIALPKLGRLLHCRYPDELDVLRAHLEAMAEKGLVEERRGKWLWLRPEAECAGVFMPRKDGADIVQLDANGYGIASVALVNGARRNFPGDRVLVRFPLENRVDGGFDSECPCARVVSLLATREAPLPAVVHRHWKKGAEIAVADPMEASCPGPFAVENLPDSVEDGETVMVRPTMLSEAGGIAFRFVETCGALDTIAVQERLVKMNRGVPQDFPQAVLDMVASLPAEPSEEDMQGRRNLRDLPFVTIDGNAAKDFDDAIQVEREGSGRGGFLLRVAIADVSTYVPLGSPLDKEALLRGNSWYFPTSVEPMLPKALSDGLCSLNPRTSRLVMWTEIHFDAQGQPGRTSFGTGVVSSYARLTYDGVKSFLLDGNEDAMQAFRSTAREPDRVLAMLEDALALYRILLKARSARGSLDFDLPESEATFDAKGRVEGLGRVARHDIHRLVEEFMIVANEAVARRLAESGLDFLYRIHPVPDREKLDFLQGALQSFGLDMRNASGRKRKELDLCAVLASAKGTPIEVPVNRLCVRAMQQARYSRVNEGHFGLASEAYCHFTSPIRRYADLTVHRALKQALGLASGSSLDARRLDRVADQINQQERLAMECEREMNKRLACLWMARQDGSKVWQASVSSVQRFGCFVELDEAPVEGLVFVEHLGAGFSSGDRFEYDEKLQMLVGEFSGAVFRVGTPVHVVCTRSDVAMLQIDFRTIDTSARLWPGGKRRQTRSRPFKVAGEAGREQRQKAKGSATGLLGRAEGRSVASLAASPGKSDRTGKAGKPASAGKVRRPSLKKKDRPLDKQGLGKTSKAAGKAKRNRRRQNGPFDSDVEEILRRIGKG